jgi:hypothetical protein
MKKIAIIGTSNTVKGRNGYVKALANEHDVNSYCIGRVPYYMHITAIINHLDEIEASDILIIDHLSNPGFFQCYQYDQYLVEFYDLLSSLNTHVVILCFPYKGGSHESQLYAHRSQAQQLAAERNITFMDISKSLFLDSDFVDPQHIDNYPSYLLGEWLAETFTTLNKSTDKPTRGYFSGYHVLHPQNNLKQFNNSLLSRNFIEIDTEEYTFQQPGQLLSLEFVSNGLCRFKINEQCFHVDDERGIFHDAFEAHLSDKTGFRLSRCDCINSSPVTTRSRNTKSHNNNLKLISLLIRNNFIFSPSLNRSLISFDISQLKKKLSAFHTLFVIKQNDKLVALKQCDKLVDQLRDIAIMLEATNLPVALKLMQQAHQLRPNGPVIKQKLNEYKRKSADNKH